MAIKLTPLERETIRRRNIERRIEKCRNLFALAVAYGAIVTAVVAIYAVTGCQI